VRSAQSRKPPPAASPSPTRTPMLPSTMRMTRPALIEAGGLPAGGLGGVDELFRSSSQSSFEIETSVGDRTGGGRLGFLASAPSGASEGTRSNHRGMYQFQSPSS